MASNGTKAPTVKAAIEAKAACQGLVYSSVDTQFGLGVGPQRIVSGELSGNLTSSLLGQALLGVDPGEFLELFVREVAQLSGLLGHDGLLDVAL